MWRRACRRPEGCGWGRGLFFLLFCYYYALPSSPKRTDRRTVSVAWIVREFRGSCSIGRSLENAKKNRPVYTMSRETWPTEYNLRIFCQQRVAYQPHPRPQFYVFVITKTLQKQSLCYQQCFDNTIRMSLNVTTMLWSTFFYANKFFIYNFFSQIITKTCKKYYSSNVILC